MLTIEEIRALSDVNPEFEPVSFPQGVVYVIGRESDIKHDHARSSTQGHPFWPLGMKTPTSLKFGQ